MVPCELNYSMVSLFGSFSLFRPRQLATLLNHVVSHMLPAWVCNIPEISSKHLVFYFINFVSAVFKRYLCEGKKHFKNLLSCFPGEGFHNYHHTFPFDYATSEFGCKLNLTTAFIDLMCFLGLATDCKSVSKEMITARVKRTGDSSYKSGWVRPLDLKRRCNVPKKVAAGIAAFQWLGGDCHACGY